MEFGSFVSIKLLIIDMIFKNSPGIAEHMSTNKKTELYIEQAARFLQLDRIAANFGWPFISGPMLLVWLLLFVDVPVLSTISYVTSGGVYIFELWPLVPVGLTLAVLLLLRLRDAYVDTVETLQPRGAKADRDALKALVIARHRRAFLMLWWGGYIGNIVLAPEAFFEFLAIEGLVIGLLKQAIIFGGYVPVLAEFTALVVTIHVLFPLELWRREYPLDFSDVSGFGGLRKVGVLLKYSTAVYYAGLIFYTVTTLAPIFLSTRYPDPTSLQAVLFPFLWAIGLVMYAVPVLIINRHVTAEKRRELERIERELRGLDPDHEDFPYVDPPQELIPEYTYKFLELQQVHNTRDYPTNISILQDIVLAALVPLAVQNGLLYLATQLFS